VTPVITRLEGKNPNSWRLTGFQTSEDVDVDGMKHLVEQFKNEHAFLLSRIAPRQFCLFWHQKTFHAAGMPPVSCARWMEMDYEGDMLQLVDLLLMKPCFGTLMRRDLPNFSAVPTHQGDLKQDFEDLCEWARKVTKDEFRKQFALATAAVQDKTAVATEEQEKMYLFRAALKDEFNNAQLKKQCVIDVTAPTKYWPWARGLSEYAKEHLVGYHYDDVAQKMVPVKLLDVFSARGSHRKLVDRKILVLHGRKKTGKTPLAHAIMKWITTTQEKQYYWYSTNYDALGKYCADNGNAHFGGYIFDDCAPISLQNTELSVDDWRGVVEIEGGSFKSRYQPAELGPGQYRILAMNSRRDKHTGMPVTFFKFFKLHACDALLRHDELAFKRACACDDADASIASRVIMFNVDQCLLSDAYLQALDKTTFAAVDERMKKHPEEHDSDDECVMSESYSESET
jgi:hypothetical protein